VVTLIAHDLFADEKFLSKHGLAPEDFEAAFAPAIEQIRGRRAATNVSRRSYVHSVLDLCLERGTIASWEIVDETKGSLHRVSLGKGRVACIICKGCPDGAHTTNWHRPTWADETYLWWLCPDSFTNEPGEGIWKGLTRLFRKFEAEPTAVLEGVIFADSACGTSRRPCPKSGYALQRRDKAFPPPCLFILKETEQSVVESLGLPAALLSAFGLDQDERCQFTSTVSCNSGISSDNVAVVNRYGKHRKSTYANRRDGRT
jgi:hypothetical protein